MLSFPFREKDSYVVLPLQGKRQLCCPSPSGKKTAMLSFPFREKDSMNIGVLRS
jgi:hypothetical protein